MENNEIINENKVIISDVSETEEEVDERMIEHEKMIDEHNTKRKLFLERITITGAYYPSVNNRNSFFVEYILDDEIHETKKELVSTTIHIKSVLSKIFKKNIPPVLYGGSVDEKSINFFKDIRIIDGFLIGGASKSSKKFIDIIRNYYR